MLANSRWGWFDWMEQPRLRRTTLTWWWRALLVHFVVRELLRYLQHGHPGRVALALGFTGCLALALREKVPRLSAQVAGVIGLCKFVAIFPDNSNHSYVELLLGLAFCFASLRRVPACTELVSFTRLLGVVVFFGSGLQKALHGTYLHGAFLATRLGEPRFAWALSQVLSAEELQRLKPESVGNGPFQFSSLLGILLSNSVYLFELGVAGLLLIPRTRTLGVWAGFFVCLGIEAVAREVMFGLLMALMLFMSARDGVARKAVLGVVAAEAAALLLSALLGKGERFFN